MTEGKTRTREGELSAHEKNIDENAMPNKNAATIPPMVLKNADSDFIDSFSFFINKKSIKIRN